MLVAIRLVELIPETTPGNRLKAHQMIRGDKQFDLAKRIKSSAQLVTD